jgi:hypothetical protein
VHSPTLSTAFPSMCRYEATSPWVLLHTIPYLPLTFQLTTCFTPDRSGTWELGLGVAGQADLYVDGNKVVDNSTDQKPGLLFVSLVPLPYRTY